MSYNGLPMNREKHLKPESDANHLGRVLLLVLLYDLLEKFLDVLLLCELGQGFLDELLVLVGEDPVDLVSILGGERLLQDDLKRSSLNMSTSTCLAAVNTLDLAQIEKRRPSLKLLMVLNAGHLVFFTTLFLL